MNPRDRRSWIIFDILQVIERTGANRVDAKKKICRVEPPVIGGIDPCHVRPGFLTVDHG
jgi:hypothetical protein